MIVHLHLLSVFKHLRHLPIPTLLFVTPILLKWVHVSYKKPTLHLPPSTSRITSLVTATPSLNRPHLPHPMTAFPAFSPLLRGLSTTSFLSAYMSSLSMLNPFTVIALILGTHKLDTVEKIIIPADSGVVSLVWSSTAPPASLNQPIILLLPGMGNSSETGFVRRLSRLLSSTTPFTVSTMDYRHVGHSSSFPSPSSRPCCADSYRDIEHVITYIHAKYKPSSLVLIGQSLGAGMLLKHLGTNPSSPVTAAIACSPPVDYRDIATQLEANPLALLANFFMAIPPKISTMMSPVVRNQVPSLLRMLLAPTVRSFEEAVLIPLLPEYSDAYDYYAQNNPSSTFNCIATPTLIVSSTDDPITPPPSAALVGENDRVALATVDYGGHLGFFKCDLFCGSWGDEVCVDFCLQVLEQMKGKGEVNSPTVNQRKSAHVVKRRGSLRGVALGF